MIKNYYLYIIIYQTNEPSTVSASLFTEEIN